jgi:succinate dehydrogenase hydrophobic anchor subunit
MGNPVVTPPGEVPSPDVWGPWQHAQSARSAKESVDAARRWASRYSDFSLDVWSSWQYAHRIQSARENVDKARQWVSRYSKGHGIDIDYLLYHVNTTFVATTHHNTTHENITDESDDRYDMLQHHFSAYPQIVAAIAGVCILMYTIFRLYACYTAPPATYDVWRAVAAHDDVYRSDPLPAYITEAFDHIPPDTDWRTRLLEFLLNHGICQSWAFRVRARYSRGNSRRRTDQRLLARRDLVFDIRALVFSRVTPTSVREDTPLNRAVVERAVSNALNTHASTTNAPSLRAEIFEACVSVCFIDTIYDETGRAIALGPDRRRV